MITEQDLSKTNISVTYKISPVENIVGDISGLLGNSCSELIGAFYSTNISRKSDVVITELLNNAIANNVDGSSNIVLEIKIDQRSLLINVKNSASLEQFNKVRAHIGMINSSADLKQLLARTIREKRREKKTGGLGLIRLAAENKFRLSVDYDAPVLVVKTEFAIG